MKGISVAIIGLAVMAGTAAAFLPASSALGSEPGSAGRALGAPGGWTSQKNPDYNTKHDISAISCTSAAVCTATGYSTMATTTGGRAWAYQTGSLDYYLAGVSCPDARTCYASGEKGAIVTTTDAGASWRPLQSRTTHYLNAISCPGVRACYAVGDGGGTIAATTNGGQLWRGQHNPLTGSKHILFGVSCSSVTTCVSVGWLVMRTTDGGATWTEQYNPDNEMLGVTCPDKQTCYAVGDKGTIMASTDGGANWTTQASGTTNSLDGIACAGVRTCYAVGDKGTIVTTSDGGNTWRGQVSGTTRNLRGIACAKSGSCYAVGEKGTILKTTSAASSAPSAA